MKLIEFYWNNTLHKGVLTHSKLVMSSMYSNNIEVYAIGDNSMQMCFTIYTDGVINLGQHGPINVISIADYKPQLSTL